jgi:hypothetical protein
MAASNKTMKLSKGAILVGAAAPLIQVGEYFYERRSKHDAHRKNDGNKGEGVASEDSTEPTKRQTQKSDGQSA